MMDKRDGAFREELKKLRSADVGNEDVFVRTVFQTERQRHASAFTDAIGGVQAAFRKNQENGSLPKHIEGDELL
jgi:hypothetical protein